MVVAVIGSRNILDGRIIESALSGYVATKIVTGGAVGVDSIGMEYAKKNNIELLVFLPEYEKYGRGAPLVRNKKIVESCDIVLAFWDGKSKGTKNTIDYANKIKKPVEIKIVD
jgi:hypothetical protein